jgi:hypothetical protein
MLRSMKDVDWSPMLAPEDIAYLVAKVEPDAWYPMATFERMGKRDPTRSSSLRTIRSRH